MFRMVFVFVYVFVWYLCLPICHGHVLRIFLFHSYQVEGVFYVNDALEKLMFEELRNACRGGGKYFRVLHVAI